MKSVASFRRHVRMLRLASGGVLFCYIALHLTCHALGLASIATADVGLRLTVMLWHSLPGSLLLYGAAAIHFALALLAIIDRPTLRMPPVQLLRILLGFGIPVLLIGHAVATRVAWEMYGAPPTYARVVAALVASGSESRQLALLAPGWLHGCMGLYLASGNSSVLRRWRPVFIALAALLPVCAALGFLAMAAEVATLPAAPALQRLAPEATATLLRRRESMLNGYFAIIVGIMLWRLWRDLARKAASSR